MDQDRQHTHLATVLALHTLSGSRLRALLGDVILTTTVAAALLARLALLLAVTSLKMLVMETNKG